MLVVTLSERARSACRRHGIPEPEIHRARRASISIHERPDFLTVEAELGGARRVRLWCSHDQPGHVVSLRLL